MKLIVANWKSNKSRVAVEAWMDVYHNNAPDIWTEASSSMAPDSSSSLSQTLEIVIAPPMPSLMYVSNRLLDDKIGAFTKLAVQDISSFPSGSYTGGVSTTNLDGYNVQYAIVGHSERRRYFHETSLEVARKVELCLEDGITPIVCVDTPYLSEQAQEISPNLYSQCVVAYEPLAAIGSGANAPLDQVSEAVQRIKSVFGGRVIYGGSVNQSDAAGYLAACDGVLVGTAALNTMEFLSIVRVSGS